MSRPSAISTRAGEGAPKPSLTTARSSSKTRFRKRDRPFDRPQNCVDRLRHQLPLIELASAHQVGTGFLRAELAQFDGLKVVSIAPCCLGFLVDPYQYRSTTKS